MLKFYTGEEKSALQRLIKLIESNRTYFVYALIDPDLMPYSDIINPQLLALFNTVKDNAISVLRAAEEELERSKKMLDVHRISEAQSLLLKTRNMLGSESYFNFLDVIHYGNSVVSICRNGIKERKKALLDRLFQLNSRVENNLNFTKKYRYPRLINSCRKQLNHAREIIRQSQNVLAIGSTSGEQIAALEKFCKKLSAELVQIELDLGKLDTVQQTLINLTMFMRRSAILLSIVLFIGILIIPAVISVIPGIESTSNTWPFQKIFLFGGIIFSIGISLFRTIKDILRDY